MKPMRFVLLVLVCMTALHAVEYTDIYEIQYTMNPGTDGTYPSTRVGQQVRTEGIVTAIDQSSGLFYLGTVSSGPWSGIQVQNSGPFMRRSIRVGDLLEVAGTVEEYFGCTRITQLTGMVVHASNQPLSNLTPVTTQEAITSEMYESVLVRIPGGQVKRSGDTVSWVVSDGLGQCPLDTCIFQPDHARINLQEEMVEVRGVIVYRFGQFLLGPRFADDFVRGQILNVNNTSWGRIKSLYK